MFAVTLAVLSYVSRVCISQAAPDITRDLHLTTEQMGQIFGAFAISYALMEIPSGLLGDWIGAKKVLIRIVLWWSAFTALTGAMFSFGAMYLVRFLFGAGEAGAFPNLTKIFTVWLPHRERLRAQAIMWTSARWAGAFTPKLVFLVLLVMSWRMAFVFFGAVGVIWVVVFLVWFKDDPHEHPGVNAAEAAYIGSTAGQASGHGNVPWRKVLSSRSVWLLWVQYFALSFPWYFFITWMPSYLKDYWKLEGGEATTLAILPLFLGGVGCAVCGWVSPGLSARVGGATKSRKIMACIGFAGAGGLLIAAIQMKQAIPAMIAMGLASFCNDLVMPPSWAACMDIGGKYAGTLSGSMNMMGNLAGFASPVVGGKILHDDPSRYPDLLYISAAVYFIGLLCWPFIDPVTPLEADDAH
ncbi:MAG: MFS transporter [Acidobacteriaceae bacterium]|nr:MFS transporter [Acidobacteriaceae bacterium]